MTEAGATTEPQGDLEQQVQLLIGQELESQDDMEGAVNAYKLAHATDRLIACGDVCVDTERFTIAYSAYEAANALDKLAQLADKSSEAGVHGVARKAMASGQMDEELIAHADTCLQEGEKGNRNHKLSRALQSLKIALDLGNDDAKDKLVSLGEEYFGKKNWDKAHEAYAAAQHSEGLTQVGDAYKRNDHLQKAARAYQDANDADGLEAIARIYLAEGSVDKAQPLLETANKEIPSTELEQMGDALLTKSQGEKAMELFIAAGANEKLDKLGDAFQLAGKLTKALRCFEVAGSKKKLIAIGDASFDAGKIGQSLQAYKGAESRRGMRKIAFHYRNDDEHFEAAKVFAELGDEARVLAIGDNFLEKCCNPDRAKAVYALVGKEIPAEKFEAEGDKHMADGGSYWVADDFFREAGATAKLLQLAERTMAAGDQHNRAKALYKELGVEPSSDALTAQGDFYAKKRDFEVAAELYERAKNSDKLRTLAARCLKKDDGSEQSHARRRRGPNIELAQNLFRRSLLLNAGDANEE